jgi:hypothetical protein
VVKFEQHSNTKEVEYEKPILDQIRDKNLVVMSFKLPLKMVRKIVVK